MRGGEHAVSAPPIEAHAGRLGAGRRLSVLQLDAHGDLNTPETSPSGNDWGMPLRMLLDGGAVEPADVVLWGARNLDPPEVEFIAATGIHDDPGALRQAVTDCSESPPHGGRLGVTPVRPGE